jgi:hypothetical protein
LARAAAHSRQASEDRQDLRVRAVVRQGSAHEQLAIELPDRGFRRFAVGVFDKRKAAGAPRLSIKRPNDLRRLTNLREM